jgi:hypothetical protein
MSICERVEGMGVVSNSKVFVIFVSPDGWKYSKEYFKMILNNVNVWKIK